MRAFLDTVSTFSVSHKWSTSSAYRAQQAGANGNTIITMCPCGDTVYLGPLWISQRTWCRGGWKHYRHTAWSERQKSLITCYSRADLILNLLLSWKLNFELSSFFRLSTVFGLWGNKMDCLSSGMISGTSLSKAHTHTDIDLGCRLDLVLHRWFTAAFYLL